MWDVAKLPPVQSDIYSAQKKLTLYFLPKQLHTEL